MKGRILAIDYGLKRCGIAHSDEYQIIATGLSTVDTQKIWFFLERYLPKQTVLKVVIGLPLDLKNNDTNSTSHVRGFIKRFKKKYPNIPIQTQDERFTSKMAHQTLFQVGLKKSKRQNKRLINIVSATIILQSYLESA